MAIKLGLWSLPPFLAAGIRFFVAFLFLSLFAIIKKLRFPRSIKTHFFFFWFGIINFTGGYAFVYWGQQYIGSGLASILFSIMPFYVLFLSIWLLPEDRITAKKFFGVLTGFAGLVLIFWDQMNFQVSDTKALYGMSAVLIAPLFSSLGTISGKRVGKSMNPIVLVTLPMFYASLSFLLLSFILERNSNPVFDFNAVFSIIYLSLVGTAIAFAVYFWMLKNTSAVLMSMITFVTPPLALFWGWFILDEYISLLLILGMMIVFAGISIVRK